MRQVLLVLVVGVLVNGIGVVHAAAPEPHPLQKSLEQAAEKFTKAFRERDATGVAALFTPEAEYIDSSGIVFHGRDAIAAEYAANFATNPPGELTLEILSIRPIAKGVVVEDGISTFRSAKGNLAVQVRYTATHTQQPDGTWLMASVRELSDPIVTPHVRLQKLGWLVGTWKEEIGGQVVSTEWKWSEDGNFLISDFSITGPQGVLFKGTHRVGWDAERQQFRSWIFDSTGGSAEGWWAENDQGTWSIQLDGVNANGERLNSTLTYARDGADGLVVSHDYRSARGIPLPALTQRIVRQSPAPGVKLNR